MEKISGLLLEIGEKDCLVLVPGNEYVRISLPDGQPLIGEMVEGYRLESRSLANRPVSRVWAYVASILITLMLGGYKVYAISAAPAAYLSLDMSPSIELALNSKGKVVKARSYNSEGASLLEEASPEDQPVDSALQTIITKALDKKAGANSGSEIIVMTYTTSPYLQEDALNKRVAEILEKHQFTGQLLSQYVDKKYREKATDSDLSPGQQLIVDLAASGNVDLPPEALKHEDTSKVLKSRNVPLSTLLEGLDKESNKHFPDLIDISPAAPPTSTSAVTPENVPPKDSAPGSLSVAPPNRDPLLEQTKVDVTMVSIDYKKSDFKSPRKRREDTPYHSALGINPLLPVDFMPDEDSEDGPTSKHEDNKPNRSEKSKYLKIKGTKL